MKYVLFVYDDGDGWHDHGIEDRRGLHNPDEYQAVSTGQAMLLAHYRLRPPRLTTTIRLEGDELVTTEGARAETQALRAVFLLESESSDAVLDVARRLPAVRMGGSVEIRPLIGPDPGRQHHGPSTVSTPDPGKRVANPPP
jgi:hypothetical protein